MANFIERFYLKEKLPPSLTALFISRVLQAVSHGLFNLFVPVFLFLEFGRSFEIVLTYYLISFLVYILTLPLGAKIMTRIGLRESMIVGTVFLIGFFTAFRYFEPVYIYLTVPIMLKSIFRILYWTPFHTEFAEFTNRMHRGRELGFLESLYAILGIGVPITAGYVVSQYGFNYLFVLVIIIAALSIFPLFLTQKVKEKFTWSYLKTYKKLFTRGNRSFSLAFAADGAQDVVGLVIWPLFIFLLLDEKYASVGVVTSMIVAAVVVLRLVFGSLADRLSKHHLVQFGSLLYSFGWVFKALISSSTHVFFAGTYHDFSKAIMRTPFDALRYEKTADHGHYVDEYTVLREIALCMGRIIMLAIIIFLLQFVDLRVAFVIAAFFSLFISVL